MNNTVRCVLLGVAQDGGVPQANCRCDQCLHARNNSPFLDGMQACLGAVDEGEGKAFLFDCSPAFGSQLWSLQNPEGGGKTITLGGIFLTHAHTGHYTGESHLCAHHHEAMGAKMVPVYCTASMATFLESNQPWYGLITGQHIDIRIIQAGQTVEVTPSLSVTPITVPHRSEISDTVAFILNIFEVSRLLYCPDTDGWEHWTKSATDVCRGVEVALMDGTFYSMDELPGRDMLEIPHPVVENSIKVSEAPARGKGEVISHWRCRKTRPTAFSLLSSFNKSRAKGKASKYSPTTSVEAAGFCVGCVDMSWSWEHKPVTHN
ncbi:unnamed protein product [Chrysoparadoxa australica]